jgi:hypothetical protein
MTRSPESRLSEKQEIRMRLHNLPDEASEDISDQRMQIAGVFVQSS